MSYEGRPWVGYKGGPALPFWIMLDRLCDVILSNVPGNIVEIGCGYSTIVLAKHAEAFGVQLHTCDYSTRKCNWVKDTFKYEGIKVYNMRSTHFIWDFKDEPAIVFIDGDHRAVVLRKEVDFFLPIVKPNGVIFLHDTCPRETTYIKKTAGGKIMDTYVVRKELEQRENKDFDIFTWPYTAGNCGLTMILKKDLTQPFYRI